MKVVICKDKQLAVAERPEPIPKQGQLLVKVLRCGICGSDLHVRQHCDHWGSLMARQGYRGLTSSSQEVVFGHEFSAEVLEHGPKTKRTLRAGTRVVSVPLLRRGSEIDLIGLSERSIGAYAERTVVEASLTMPIPNGLAPDIAALTEPMAVGWHAVLRSEIKRKDVAIVIGCGPVGLAIICLLKAKGIDTIVASDFSAGRRALANQCGADIVVNPAESSPYADWKEFGFIGDTPSLLELAVGTKEQLDKLPLPWWLVWRMADQLGLGPNRPIVFECVGAKGVLQSIINGAPQFSRVMVVGVCMQADQIEPAIAITKEIELCFVQGYSPLEFRDTLHLLAEGKVNAAPLVTSTVGLGGVEEAFNALRNPDRHAKILIDPTSTATVE
ncbi:MAG: zinc-binding dehydrogenase [Pseudomonadota bacterium]